MNFTEAKKHIHQFINVIKSFRHYPSDEQIRQLEHELARLYQKFNAQFDHAGFLKQADVTTQRYYGVLGLSTDQQINVLSILKPEHELFQTDKKKWTEMESKSFVKSVSEIQDFLLSSIEHPYFLRLMNKSSFESMKESDQKALRAELSEFHIGLIHELATSVKTEQLGLLIAYIRSGHFEDFVQSQKMPFKTTVKEVLSNRDFLIKMTKDMQEKEIYFNYVYQEDFRQKLLNVEVKLNTEGKDEDKQTKRKNCLDACVINPRQKKIVVAQCTADELIEKQADSYFKAHVLSQAYVDQSQLYGMDNPHHGYHVDKILVAMGMFSSESGVISGKQEKGRKFLALFDDLTSADRHALSEIQYYAYFGNSDFKEHLSALVEFTPYVIGVNGDRFRNFLHEIKNSEEKEKLIALQLSKYMSETSEIIANKLTDFNQPVLDNYFINAKKIVKTIFGSNYKYTEDEYSQYVQPMIQNFLKINKENILSSNVREQIDFTKDKCKLRKKYEMYLDEYQSQENSGWSKIKVNYLSHGNYKMIDLPNEQTHHDELTKQTVLFFKQLQMIYQKDISGIHDIFKKLPLTSTEQKKFHDAMNLWREIQTEKDKYHKVMESGILNDEERKNLQSYAKEEFKSMKTLVQLLKSKTKVLKELSSIQYQNQYKDHPAKKLAQSLSFMHDFTQTKSSLDYNENVILMEHDFKNLCQEIQNKTDSANKVINKINSDKTKPRNNHLPKL